MMPTHSLEKRNGPAANETASNYTNPDVVLPIVPLVGASVEAKLEATLFLLIAGDLELNDLTPALAGWWYIAYQSGRAACQHEHDERLLWERNLFYFLYANPNKKPGDFYTHLEDTLWSEAVSA